MIVPMLMPRMRQRWGWGSLHQHQARQEDGQDEVGYGRSTHGSFAADLTLAGDSAPRDRLGTPARPVNGGRHRAWRAFFRFTGPPLHTCTLVPLYTLALAPLAP